MKKGNINDKIPKKPLNENSSFNGNDGIGGLNSEGANDGNIIEDIIDDIKDFFNRDASIDDFGDPPPPDAITGTPGDYDGITDPSLADKEPVQESELIPDLTETDPPPPPDASGTSTAPPTITDPGEPPAATGTSTVPPTITDPSVVEPEPEPVPGLTETDPPPPPTATGTGTIPSTITDPEPPPVATGTSTVPPTITDPSVIEPEPEPVPGLTETDPPPPPTASGTGTIPSTITDPEPPPTATGTATAPPTITDPLPPEPTPPPPEPTPQPPEPTLPPEPTPVPSVTVPTKETPPVNFPGIPEEIIAGNLTADALAGVLAGAFVAYKTPKAKARERVRVIYKLETKGADRELRNTFPPITSAPSSVLPLRSEPLPLDVKKPIK